MGDVDAILDGEYIASDGAPVGETETHGMQIWYLIAALQEHARRSGAQDVHAHGNQFFYYERGNPRKSVCPDAYWIKGIPQLPPRDLWKLWEEPAAPQLVVEVASRSSWEDDLGWKKAVYRDVFRTSEYVVFDPLEDIIEPNSDGSPRGPLLAWRLVSGVYRRVGSASRFESRVLGATFQVIDGLLKLVDAQGQVVPGTVPEAHARGRSEGLRDAVVAVLEDRFARLSPSLLERLDRLSAEEARAALLLAAKVTRPEDVLPR